MSLFDKEYVKTGVFPKELSRWLHEAFDLRQRSDYAVRYVPSREDAQQVVNEAGACVSHVNEKLEEEMGSSD